MSRVAEQYEEKDPKKRPGAGLEEESEELYDRKGAHDRALGGLSAAYPGTGTEQIQMKAQEGLADASGSMPHLARLQSAFGDHDLGGVRAAVGGSAAQANEAMGSAAYAQGDRVAFRSAPDLHTAAHEAAHAVVQRSGKGPDGVGTKGDAYERHADEVADRVVAGRSVESLLDKMTGPGRSSSGASSVQHKPIQFLHGDVANTKAMTSLGALDGESVAEAVTRKHGKRDANFNNARKVELESKLTAAILRNPQCFQKTVHKVSRAVMGYIDRKAAAGVGDAIIDLNKMVGGGQYFGRLFHELQASREAFAATLRRVLAEGGGVMTHHLMAHQQFKSDVFDRDVKKDIAKTFVEHAERDPGYLRSKTEATVNGETFNPLESANRGRIAPGQAGSQVVSEDAIPMTAEASGIAARENGAEPIHSNPGGETVDGALAGTEQNHQRGIDRWTMDESKPFIQQARIELDMPLAAGASGSTADMMQVAYSMGCSPTEMVEYGLGTLGFLGSAGAHSFHEIMTVCQAAGVAYTPGDYRGCYPPSFEATADFQQLKAEYADLLGGDVGATAAGGSGQRSAAAEAGDV